MNWPAKTAGFLVIAFAILLAACEAPKEIGLPPEVIAEVQFTDTVTVRTSTVLLDSVRTSNAQQMLVGNYRDPIFGRVSAQPFFEMGQTLNLNSDGSTNTYVFDSLRLNVAYSYLYGDTLQPFEVKLHRLSDSLRTGKNYYNNSSIPYDAPRWPVSNSILLLQPTIRSSLNFLIH